MNKEESDARFTELFNKYVPHYGQAETLGGEIIRAVARIQYRWWNDGDKAWEGYGRETVNPAVRFLMMVCDGEGEALSVEFRYRVEKIYNLDGHFVNDTNYENMVEFLVQATIKCVEETQLCERKNDYGDMLECRNEEEDVEDYDDEEDYYEYEDDDEDNDDDEE